MLNRNACIVLAWFSFLLVILNFVSGLGAVADKDPLWLIGTKFATSVIWAASGTLWASAARNRS